MTGAEGVVAVDVAERGERVEVRRIVGLAGLLFESLLVFTGIEADVFQQQHAAVDERLHLGLSVRADGVGNKRDRSAEQFGESRGDGLEAELRLRPFAFGAAEVAHQDGSATAIEDRLNGWERHADSQVVGDPVAVERHVEIDSDENGFVADVDVGDGFLGHDRTFRRLGLRPDISANGVDSSQKRVGTESQPTDGVAMGGIVGAVPVGRGSECGTTGRETQRSTIVTLRRIGKS